MANLSHHQMSTVDRPLALRARGDVQLAESQFAGHSTYVLKDPLSLEMFHLTPEEFFLFQAMKLRTTLGKLRREFERRFTPRRISAVALQEGLNQLHQRGLLISEAPAQGEQLLERRQERNRQERLQSIFQLLSIRLGSVDATSLIDGLYRRLNWLLSWPCLLLGTLLALYALRALLSDLPRFIQSLSAMAELAKPRYWLLWIATIAAVKCIHELAHALACKHFGGRCHEIGVMLLAFVPCLYCDVSDAWRLSSKWQRIAVSSAGMIVELLIAALALLCWWNTEPGLLQLWCLSVVIVCSVGTVLINANPLLRYDGYYILSDLLEVPNLATRSRGLLADRLRNWLLNQPTLPDPLLGPGRRRALTIYAIAAKVYLTLLVVLIFAGLLRVARPYHMENLVYTLAVVTLSGMVAAPLVGVFRLWRNPGVRYRLRIPRALLLVALVTIIAAGVCCIPIERSFTGPVVFVPRGAQTVYATVGGRLEYAVTPGTAVKQGEVLARLADPKVNLALAEQEGEFQVRRVSYRQLQTMRAWDETASARTPTAHAALADAESQLKELRRQAEELVLVAPRDGVVIAPPQLEPPEQNTGQLPTWTGSPLDSKNLGCWIEPATVLCSVGDPDALEVLVAIDEADVPEVVRGQQVRILVASAPVRVVVGEVIDVSRRASGKNDQTALGSPGKQHLVEVELTTEDRLALIGTRGTAKIAADSRTLWQIVSRELREMLKLPW